MNQRNSRSTIQRGVVMESYLLRNTPPHSQEVLQLQNDDLLAPQMSPDSPSYSNSETPRQRGCRKGVKKNRSKVYKDLCMVNMKLKAAERIRREIIFKNI